MTRARTSRLSWFDANRVCAAMGVVLIHSTSDFAGGAFPKATAEDRVIPVLLRSIGEFSGSEMFFLFSLFLIAMKLDRKRLSYTATLAEQARRLLVPFAVWTVFYAFFRLIKADTFHYGDHIRAELADWHSWLGYFALGSGQYHLHFLPTLFLLLMFLPVMRLGQRYPIFGLMVAVTLGAMHSAQGAIWGWPVSEAVRDVLLRGTKVMGYVGYGIAASAIFGLWKDGIPRGESRLLARGAIFFAVVAWLGCLPFYGAAVATGAWGAREGWSFYGHFLMPFAIFAFFLGRQHADWSPRWSSLARYTFGVYLVHPAVIDLFDVGVTASGLALTPAALVLARFAVVLPATLGIVMLMARTRPLAWTIGLGPAPWEWQRQPKLSFQE